MFFVLEELSASYRVSSLTVFPWEGKEELSALQISGKGGDNWREGEKKKKKKSVLPPFMIYS